MAFFYIMLENYSLKRILLIMNGIVFYEFAIFTIRIRILPFIFERELALLVALQGASSWKGVEDAVSRRFRGKSSVSTFKSSALTYEMM